MDLQGGGVSVMYGPVHEMNGGWCWWGATGYNTNDATRHNLYIDLYRDMYQYFTYTKGLNNLIWVWSPDANRDYQTNYYPGDAYVDIVGIDAYTPSPTAQVIKDAYNNLSGIGKPMALAEIGPNEGSEPNYDYQALITAIHTDYRLSLIQT